MNCARLDELYSCESNYLNMVVFVEVIILTAVGREAKGIEFSRERDIALEEEQPATGDRYLA